MEKENKTTAEEVIKKIKEEGVTPIARWHFVLRNNGFWSLWGISVLIGSCATAGSIFVFTNAGWQYQAITHDSFLHFLMDVIPVFWLLSFFIMVLFGYFNVRHTNRGYRFSFYLVVLASVIASFVGGTILYAIGVGRNIDDLRRPLSFAPPILTVEESRWNNSGRGLLSGVVKSFDQQNEVLTLTLFSGEDKALSTRELGISDLNYLVPKAHIRIIGGIDNDESTPVFVACAVIPWEAQSNRNILLPNSYIPPIISGAKKEDRERITICKDVKPYQFYRKILITK